MHGIKPAALLVLGERLSGVGSPARLLPSHFAVGILGPDDLRYRKNERPVASKMRAKPILGAPLPFDCLAFELADAGSACGERGDDALTLERVHFGPRPMTRLILVEAPLRPATFRHGLDCRAPETGSPCFQRLPGGVGAARTCALAAFPSLTSIQPSNLQM
jgi:hypothetical protein